jgi:hypothetical protein
MADELLIVTAGERRYAVPQRMVATLQRVAGDPSARSLAAMLGAAASSDDQLVVRDPLGRVALCVAAADLCGTLPQYALPAWIVPLAHPAVRGVALDRSELVPVLDLTQLALEG